MSQESCYACRKEGKNKCDYCDRLYCDKHGGSGLCRGCKQRVTPYEEKNAEHQTRFFIDPFKRRK